MFQLAQTTNDARDEFCAQASTVMQETVESVTYTITVELSTMVLGLIHVLTSVYLHATDTQTKSTRC
jgi:hypothetical protein